MQFKLDENLAPHLAEVFRDAGHDAVSVLDQRLQGASDSVLFEVCRREGRALVTLDLGFADIRTYPPAEHSGANGMPSTSGCGSSRKGESGSGAEADLGLWRARG